MSKRMLLAGLVAGAILAPGGAFADHGNSNCNYTSTQEQHQGVAPLFVYADTNGGGGHTDSADQSAGVCIAGTGSLEFGHSATRGVGGPTTDGFYLILDGQSGNPDPLDGYVGVSNYEFRRANQPACPNDPNSNARCSTNSGGNVGAFGNNVPVPLLVCGNTTGDWDNTERNGCEYP
ncbi:MAG: hypothetical protein ACRDJM_03980 [Actinomycetota bacterium]